MRSTLVLIGLSLSLCFAGAARAEPSKPAYVRRFEAVMCPDGTPLAAPIDGDPARAMELAVELYKMAGPKIGCRFVEPCFLLCLGDLRPYAAGDGLMVDPVPQDQEVLDKLNAILVPRGLSIHPHEPTPDGKVPTFSLRSLRGLELRTQDSKLPWVPVYQRSSGWNGYYDWKDATYARLPDDRFAFDRVEGIMLGYPDVAVEGYAELVWDGWPTTVKANIPEAYHYFCGAPIFELSCRQAGDPGVVRTEQSWQQFLQQAYATPANQSLQKDPAFLSARVRLQASLHDGPTFEGDPRYSESRRLGLTVRTAGPQLTTLQESWLLENLGLAQSTLAASGDISRLAARGGAAELSSEHVWEWLLRGSTGADPASTALYETYLASHPAAFEQMYRRELSSRAKSIASRAANDNPGWDGQALNQMLDSSYCRQNLVKFSAEEGKAVRIAVEARSGYPPLGRLLAEARSGKGPYAALWKTP